MFSKKKLFKINNKFYPFLFPVINSLAYFFSKVTEKIIWFGYENRMG